MGRANPHGLRFLAELHHPASALNVTGRWVVLVMTELRIGYALIAFQFTIRFDADNKFHVINKQKIRPDTE